MLSSAITRLGNMGKTINEELKSQGRLLDAFTEDVDDTSGRMRQAMGVMNKMLKSKDRGKFCAILVLTLVLGTMIHPISEASFIMKSAKRMFLAKTRDEHLFDCKG